MLLHNLNLNTREILSRTTSTMTCRVLPGHLRERVEKWRRRAPAAAEIGVEDYVVQTWADGSRTVAWNTVRNENLFDLDGDVWELVESKAVNHWR